MTEPVHEEQVLAEGAWHPNVHAALLDLMDEHGVNSPTHDPEHPPLAVISCDDTLVVNDLSEATLRYVVTRRLIHADRGFWNLLPDRLGREGVRSAYAAVAGRSDAEVSDTAAYRRYRAGLIGVYEALRSTESADAAYTFAARILRGLHERTVADLIEEVLDYEFGRPLSNEEIAPGPPFAGLLVPVGMRVYREMLNLIDVLEMYGFQTWIISSSNQYILRALARRIEFPEERALGATLHTQSGVLTDRLEDPTPIGEGKLELYLDTVGRSPVLAIGDYARDFDILENCEGLSIVVDRGDDEQVESAKEQGWLVQQPMTV